MRNITTVRSLVTVPLQKIDVRKWVKKGLYSCLPEIIQKTTIFWLKQGRKVENRLSRQSKTYQKHLVRKFTKSIIKDAFLRKNVSNRFNVTEKRFYHWNTIIKNINWIFVEIKLQKEFLKMLKCEGNHLDYSKLVVLKFFTRDKNNISTVFANIKVVELDLLFNLVKRKNRKSDGWWQCSCGFS